jgi:hypothetical protein
MPQDAPPLSYRVVAPQQPIQGGDRADIVSFVEEGCHHRGRRDLGKTIGIEQIKRLSLLLFCEGARTFAPRGRAGFRNRIDPYRFQVRPASIEGRPT